MAAKHAHQRPFADFKSGGDIKISVGKLLNSVIILSCKQKVKFRTSKTQQNTPKITCTNTRKDDRPNFSSSRLFLRSFMLI